ncbi:hypothetical protein ZWY2020_026013 [Hordeum vulgare]|nr:hypothetical protein ZWY2020_026013 [Hordeum vulgare]
MLGASHRSHLGSLGAAVIGSSRTRQGIRSSRPRVSTSRSIATQAEAASRPNRDEAKARGNAAFSAGRFEEAAGHFGDAIALVPDNHVLFSNAGGLAASAIRRRHDADRTVVLRPDWAKGYSRLGAPCLGLGDAVGTVEAYEKGLALEPSNAALKDGLAQARWPSRVARPLPPTPLAIFSRAPTSGARPPPTPPPAPTSTSPTSCRCCAICSGTAETSTTTSPTPRMLQVFSLMLNVKVQNQNNEASEPKSPAPAPSKSSPPPPHQQKNPSSPRILYWTTPTFPSPMGGSGEWQRVAVDRLFAQRTRDKRGSMEMRNEAVVGVAGRTER